MKPQLERALAVTLAWLGNVLSYRCYCLHGGRVLSGSMFLAKDIQTNYTYNSIVLVKIKALPNDLHTSKFTSCSPVIPQVGHLLKISSSYVYTSITRAHWIYKLYVYFIYSQVLKTFVCLIFIVVVDIVGVVVGNVFNSENILIYYTVLCKVTCIIIRLVFVLQCAGLCTVVLHDNMWFTPA